MKITFWGREPSLFLGLLAVALQVSTAFWGKVSVDQQAAINTAAAAVVGLIIAIVAHDSWAAPMLGGVQAVIAAAVGFGLDWSPDRQALVLSLVSAVVAVFVRQVVVAPVARSSEKHLLG